MSSTSVPWGFAFFLTILILGCLDPSLVPSQVTMTLPAKAFLEEMSLSPVVWGVLLSMAQTIITYFVLKEINTSTAADTKLADFESTIYSCA